MAKKEIPSWLVEKYLHAHDTLKCAKDQLETVREEVLPFFQKGSISPTIGGRVLIYTEPERTTWSWKEEYIKLQAERKYGVANKANIAKATKFAIKLQDKAPKTPCPTINVEDLSVPKKGKAKK